MLLDATYSIEEPFHLQKEGSKLFFKHFCASENRGTISSNYPEGSFIHFIMALKMLFLWHPAKEPVQSLLV